MIIKIVKVIIKFIIKLKTDNYIKKKNALSKNLAYPLALMLATK